MSQAFASGKYAIGECDRCGFQYKLNSLKKLTVNERLTNTKVCSECWEEDHPQLAVGRLKVVDSQAVKEPRSDSGSLAASRNTQYNTRPVGLSDPYDLGYPNNLKATGSVGSVTVSTP
tara:strand:+ start:6415 stop:6768 length:354 start_codon:yes stop_codon:yes gene_type:complete